MKFLLEIYLLQLLSHVVYCDEVEQTDYDEEDFRSFLDEDPFEPSHDAVRGDYKIKPAKGFPKEKLPSISAPACGKRVYKHPDIDLDIPDIIKKYGYEFELQKVFTEDGYILGVFRIPGSPQSPSREGKVPVYLNHGLMGSALSWLFLYGNNSLAFKLADAGYDVFIGNSRGNVYSQGHLTLNTSSPNYWDFSFHEMGYFDVPAVIDHILNITGQSDIYYVGHSMGTTQYMIAMSERPEYGDKIRVGFLLSPAGFIHNLKTPILLLFLSILSATQEAWKTFIGPSMDEAAIINLAAKSCEIFTFDCGGCNNLAFQINGYNAYQNNVSIAAFFSKRYYDVSATKVFGHFSQSLKFKSFKQYDYLNSKKNLKKYKSIKPPDYKLSRITAPTVAYWGYSDVVTTPEDVKSTLRMFNPSVLKENNRVQIGSFNHLDFLIANDVQKYVYNRIQFIMDKKMYLDKFKFRFNSFKFY